MNKKGIIIYHNPNCGTSRNTLAMIRQSGVEPSIVEYLITPPTRKELVALLKSLKMKARDLLREKGTPYHELGLDNPNLKEDQLLDLMVTHPLLINRPIVITPKGTRLCRPSEVVLEILPNPDIGNFKKEDGSLVQSLNLKKKPPSKIKVQARRMK